MSRRRRTEDLAPRNANQKELLSALQNFQLTFAVGPAGTGKTYMATRFACELLQAGVIKTIIVTRPMVEAEEEIGFLPGDANEKFAPYFAPIREIMDSHFGGSHVEGMVKAGQIQIAPIAFMRGRTFNDCFVLFDEAQNTTPKQMKLFLTRLGDYARVCVSGDLDQVDITGPSGLEDALARHSTISEVKVIKFDERDVVRSKLVRKILAGY